MPELILLNEALEGILDGVVTLVESEVKKEGLLEGINLVIRGDRSRPNPMPPAIWVFGMPASCDHSQRSYAEKWIMDISLVAVVKSLDPEDGYKAANRFAARARSAVLGDRTLGKRKYVQDVRSGRFDPSGPDKQKESLFAATAIVQVHFVILEKNP